MINRKIRGALILLFLLVLILKSNGQETKPGYILEIRGDKVYLDFKTGEVTIGSKLKVVKEGEFFTHPITGEKIKEEDETIAILEISDVKPNYSVATVYPVEAISKLQKGTKVFRLVNNDIQQQIFKKSIAVQPLTVSNIQGYLGIYIGDVLTEQLLKTDLFKVLDRQTLGLQADQIVLSAGGVLTESELIKYSSKQGADYYITGTMYEPDVVELSTGIPVKNIVKIAGYAAQAITGSNLKADVISEFFPDKSEVKRLKAIVKITLKVVDVKTGEIKFLCTEMQESEGESEINLEGGILGGLKVKGGASSFLNTITGKATQEALSNLSNYVIDYFKGKITEKTYTGNIIEVSNLMSNNTTKEIKIVKLIKKKETLKQGNNSLQNYSDPLYSYQENNSSLKSNNSNTNDSVLYAILNQGKNKKIKSKSYLNVYVPTYNESLVSGEQQKSKPNKVGFIEVTNSFNKTSEGKLFFKKGYYYKNAFDLNSAFAKKNKAWNTAYFIFKLPMISTEGIFHQTRIKGLGYMIYGNWGGYFEVIPETYQKEDAEKSIILVSLGFIKSVGRSTALRFGSSFEGGSYIMNVDLGVTQRIANKISIISGISFGALNGRSNIYLPIGIGFTF